MLESATDAKGRSLEVFKVPLPPNLFITEEEEQGLKVCILSALSLCSCAHHIYLAPLMRKGMWPRGCGAAKVCCCKPLEGMGCF